MRVDKTWWLLVVACIGLVGVNGWLGYDIFRFMKAGSGGRAALFKDLQARFTEARQRKGTAASAQSWDFSSLAAWSAFRTANFIGKEKPKPKPKPDGPKGPVKPDERPPTPIKEVLELKLICGRDTAGLAWVHYRGPVTGPGEETPSSRSANHLLAVGEKLYPPHQAWQLKSILPTGLGLMFECTEKGKSRTDQILLPQITPEMEHASASTLGYNPDDRMLVKDGSKGTTKAGTARPTRPKTIRKVDPDLWKGDRITKDRGGDWVIPRKIQEKWRNNPEKALQGVRLRPYSLKKGRFGSQRSGLAIAKLSPQMQSVGLEEGMVVISVNGKAVTSKASLYNSVKKMYRRGTRDFQARVLHRGREKVITFRAPDKK